MIKLLYGTSNPGKIKYMKKTLEGLDIELISLKDIENLDIGPVIEDGNNPLENAKIKALAYYKALKMPVFSCDSGLYIEGLENEKQPGVHVRRVNGKTLNDDEMIEYYTGLAEELEGNARAKFKNAICLVFDEDNIFEYDGEGIASQEFLIATKAHPKRVNGFPMNSMSINIETGQYYMDIRDYDNSDHKLKKAKAYRDFFLSTLFK